MQVVESIRVRAEQDRIQRGIYRDFPTGYRDRFGNRYRVDYSVTGVQRDGVDENYFTEARANGKRTYIGRGDVILPAGEYTYTFSYTTSRQLGFFADHDELYWNVTGNGWEFPIDYASARIFLPEGIVTNTVTASAYTGTEGSTEQAFEEYRYKGGTVFIEAARPLGVQEGLTIVVGWPKGFVVEPTAGQRLEYFYRDNRHIIIGMAGLLLVLGYYLLVWVRLGRDPKPGVLVTRYQPPDGYSPASLRFIERMGYDRKCFASAVINLAVKGYLKINEADGEYTLARTGNDVSMARGEAALAKKLFGGSWTRALKPANHSWISDAMQAHQTSLEHDYEFNYFNSNYRYFIGGMILTIAAMGFAVVMMPDRESMGGSVFMITWLSIWSFGVYFLIQQALHAWRRTGGGVMTVIAAVHVTVFALIFIAAEIFVIVTFGRMISWVLVAMILIGAAINWLFYELLKAPTLAGRNLLDKVAGFRNYIEVAEKQELAFRHPNGRSPELFEMYLPYALALGVEQKWAEKFADVLTKVSSAGTVAYHPVWYSGSNWDNNHIGDFSSSLGSGFSNAIAASATAPGSTSGGGSGGGGSSGGGGGGGGGGGW
jgi:uncharacterized membrane protein YgcG